jgi:carboxymethylenebutenolidase
MALLIDYYVSLNSPWTHLGAARIEALAAQHGAELRIWPVDFGTIFAGSGGLPLPKRSPQRQAYRLQELQRWREALGIPINIQPKHSPANELPGAACVIALRETQGHAPAIRLAHRILKALWQEEQDADALLRLAEDPRWLEQRKADTAAALERGVFGAPCYVIGEDMFWGQDRLEFVAKRLNKGA